jgi:hypothetical protein
MKRFYVTLLAACLVTTALLATGQPARADCPQYLFLAPTYYGHGQFVPTPTYAYGWFGASSTPHAVFHWDFYDHRWIWR